jgi:protein involved in polysaccharide export with SLBB domain
LSKLNSPSALDSSSPLHTQELNLDYAAIERLDPTSLRWSLIPFNLRRALAGEELHNLVLQTGDRINLFTKREIDVPNAQRTRLVNVSGEVQNPGTYQTDLGETLDQILSRAGGLTSDAYLPGIFITRESVRAEQQRNLEQLLRTLESDLASQTAFAAQNLAQTDSAATQALFASQRQTLDRFRTLRASGRIALDLDPSTPRPLLPRIELEDGDVIQIPRVSGFVGVFGAVDISSSLIFRPGLRVKDYLDRAGLRQSADIYNIIILRADGSVRTSRTVTQRRSLLAWRGEDLFEQQVYPGESILVPEEIDRRSPYVRFIAGVKDWTQLIYQFGLGAAAFKVLRQ